MTAESLLWFRRARRMHRSAWGHPRPSVPKPQPAQDTAEVDQ
ncbi:hypothetical protein HWB60_gp072 [Mycobacterium phage TChen]|uniref:Uncharacterized protein n=1 Tax=Mycobacterium phage TChen TaxID=2163598 RepID=A0A2S1PD56_9CAUD|nr:hypothetical protein HWB60_gp072 [Mycobacterium phage TChen]AVP42395.1 hypothetical protein SEA_MISHA28_73 [Mycobacterium phage Misha28]AVP42489.1 hypothetical protein SEA_TOOTSIEPOP_73 [Mycobacterium phage TootsiePop]AWH14468.1 hypothetical protein SEA_TCHEN_72 [Mycobacterium phage TChen]